MRAAVLPLLVFLVVPALAQDAPDPPAKGEADSAQDSADYVPTPAEADRPVLRLRIQDVGRLALRNSPRFRVRLLDTAIARTFEAEAMGEFDPIFASRATGGRDKSRVFFDPSGFGPGGGSAGDSFLQEDRLSASAGLTATEEWGGIWNLGADASSADRTGASSIQSLQPRYEGLLSLGYTHPLLRGAGRDVRLSRAREAQKRTSETEGRLTREAELTVLDAESLYWELVGRIADRAVLHKSLDLTHELLDVARARFEAGRGIPADVAEAEAGLARREGELIDLQARIGNLSDRLRELVMPFEGPGSSLELTILPVDIPAEGLDELPAEPDRELLETALLQRTDVRATQAALDAAEQAELRAHNEESFELNALLNAGLRGFGSGFSETSDEWQDRDNYVWEAGLELSIPIGNVTATARLRRAERLTQQARRELIALRNTVVREIREAVRNTRSSVDRIRAAKRERIATEAQLTAEQSRLEKGKSTPFRVLEKEEDRSRAIATVIRARVDLENARAALSSALGSLLTERDLGGLAVGE